MKRFLKILALLIVALLLLASGVDATLDHLSRVPARASLAFYTDHGAPLVVYDGDLEQYKSFSRSNRLSAPIFLHRT